MTEVTRPGRLAHSSRTAVFSRLASGFKRIVRCKPKPSEPLMHTFYDDIATALVSVTYAVASVSAIVITLATVF